MVHNYDRILDETSSSASYEDQEEDQQHGSNKNPHYSVYEEDHETVDLNPEPKDEGELFLFTSSEKTFSDLRETFSSISTLIIHKQPIKSVRGIESLPQLSDLWITECRHAKLETITLCTSVKRLHLYCNGINEVPLLNNLRQLQLLDLSENTISAIENLECLEQLQTLYLSDNIVEIIGLAFQRNTCLKELDLSGNKLTSLRDLQNLLHNRKLKKLSCRSCAEIKSCPLTFMCNYRSYVVANLPQLNCLDSFPIEQTERKRVKEFYYKKTMYYNMMYHRYLQHYFIEDSLKAYEMNSMLADVKDVLTAYIVKKLLNKDAENECHATEMVIPHQAQDLMKKFKIWKEQFLQCRTRCKISRKFTQGKINLMLKAVGNLSARCEENNNMLEQLCHNLMKQFMCKNLSIENGITDVNVKQTYRVVNNEMTRKEDCEHVYMLLANTCTSLSNLWDLFDSSTSYEFKMTTCLSLCDSQWLSDVRASKEQFKTMPASLQEETRIAVILKLPSDSKLEVQESDDLPPNHNHNKPALGDQVCRNWKFVNTRSIHSIFVVEYNYVFDKSSCGLQNLKDTKLWKNITKGLSNNQSGKVCVFNNITLTQILRHPSPWKCLTDISFQGLNSGAQFSKDVPPFELVFSLNLSCNNISSVEFIARLFPILKSLNLSFNKLTSLSSLKKSMSLKELDISWNNIRNSYGCLERLSITTPNLEVLNISNNPILDFTNQDHMVVLTSQLLPNLRLFDATLVKNVLETLNVVNMEEDMYSKGSLKDIQPIRLNIDGVDHTNEIFQPNKIESLSEDIEWISLKNNRVMKVTNLIPNVSLANLSENFITDIGFTKHWNKLTELNLHDNIVTHLHDGLMNSHNSIVKLDLSDNYITSIKIFKQNQFPSLKYLNLTNNKLSSLEGVQSCTVLKEIYVTNNYISRLNDIAELKSCRHLKIIDLSINEVSKLDEFVKYIVFHFRKIEYINCNSVQETDIQDSFQLYGGILDVDYLLRCHSKVELQYLKHMSITQNNIKRVSLTGDLLPSLESLNLESNEITCLIGTNSLPSLKSLNLSYNEVHSFTDERVDDLTMCFPKLEVLYLNNNLISCLEDLKLWCLPTLASLFLHCNQIESVAGLGQIDSLKTLIIDRNRIKKILPDDFPDLKNIEELYIESNKIKDLAFLKRLPLLKKLFVGHNKIEHHEQLKNLLSIPNLQELTLLGNPLCRVFHHYRQTMLYLPLLERLDGLSLDIEEYI